VNISCSIDQQSAIKDKIMRILLVDDDDSTRRLLDAMLTKMGHEVVHANDGMEAWKILQHDQINFVLSDWIMPRMDGVELCRRLRASDRTHYTYVVLFTGKDQDDDVVVAMEAGADDFLTKPVQANELKVRIESGRRVLSLEENLNKKNRELEFVNEALEASQQRILRDLQAAAAIQRNLLPQAPLDCFPVDLAWEFMPADELAGDIFNFYPLDDDHMGFYLADVSGHGVPAAMMSVHLSKTLSAEPRPDSLVRLSEPEKASDSAIGRNFLLSALNCGDKVLNRKSDPVYREPKDVAARLNSQFQTGDDSMLYFTMIYGVLNTRTGQGTLCQAGHPYPLICRNDGSVQRLGEGGLPIGLMLDASFEQVKFKLHRGDRLLVYSDGITEAMNPAKEPFGEDRLADCLTDYRSRSLQQTVEQVKFRLAEWHGSAETDFNLADDASMLAIERSE
jgi:sigma-B regulation protein RsbU (phosphoserine phosphatase)